ncbi:MAG: diguanylate cyclase [Proteobacteria bacterium]|nr:diguanylate cyclase [Pseudomonadota bacterium]
MGKLTKIQVGWIQAFIAVLIFYGLINVTLGYLAQVLEINKIIFTISNFIGCSFCLLFYAKDGELSRETMRSTDTWIYGLIMILGYLVLLTLFSLVSPVEVSLIQRLSVLFSFLIGWFFFKRTPNKGQIFGIGLITFGVFWVVSNVHADKVGTVIGFMLLSATFKSLRVFSAEFHRPHKKAVEDNSIKSRCRVVGYIMFVVSVLFFLLALITAYINSLNPSETPLVNVTFADFFSYQSVLLGLLLGALFYAPLRTMEFSIAESIKSENFLAVGALSFFATWFWQTVTSPLTGLETKEFGQTDIIAGLIISVGALIMAISKMRSSKNKAKSINLKDYIVIDPQNITDVDDSKHLINVSMQYFNQNVEKVSKALGLPIEIISDIKFDNDNMLALKGSVFKKVSKKYTKNIAIKDSLTGVLNKDGFLLELREYFARGHSFDLLFIDLNKFKPVNDKFGHDAGDFVIAGIGKRLRRLMKNKGVVGRLGGDEFAVLVKNSDNVSDVVEQIKVEINKEFVYKSDKIQIGASIGIANHTEADTTEALIKLADENMYLDKGNKGR